MTAAIDMSAFIEAKSDQLNADDLMGGPRIVTVTSVKAHPDSAEQPISISYQGDDGKPFKPCKTMRRVMVAVWGADASQYVGRSMTLYRDAKVSFGGMQVGGIRISHMSHMEREMVVAAMVTRGKKAPFKIMPLKVEPTEDRAAKFTAAFINAVGNAADLEALDAIKVQYAGKLTELQAKRPELASDAYAAFDARAAELSQPGRSDKEHGDQHDDTQEEEF